MMITLNLVWGPRAGIILLASINLSALKGLVWHPFEVEGSSDAKAQITEMQPM